MICFQEQIFYQPDTKKLGIKLKKKTNILRKERTVFSNQTCFKNKYFFLLIYNKKI